MIRRIRDYPKEILVREEWYEVRFAQVIPGEPKSTLGLACQETKTIWIKLGQSPRDRFKTLMHEIMHIIEYEYDLKIPHRLIYALEEPLIRLILDNAS